MYFHVLDLETTGFDQNKDEIAEIALITVLNTQIIDIYHNYFRIESITDGAAEKNGLSVEMLRGFLSFKSDWNINYLGTVLKYPIFAHNSSFDARFMIANGVFNEHYPLIDTLKLCKKADKNLSNNKLQTWLAHYSINPGRPHTALSDALGLTNLIIKNGWQLKAA